MKPASFEELQARRISVFNRHETRYKRTRPKGFTEWEPKRGLRLEVAPYVIDLVHDRREDWPIGPRWIAYRLCDKHGFGKTQPFFTAVGDVCLEGRRSINVDIPMEAIADNRAGHAYVEPFDFDDSACAIDHLRRLADAMEAPLQDGQPVYLEAWTEAAGMLGIVSRILKPYGIRVTSGGGSVALRTKYDLYQRVTQQAVPFRLLYLGDLDKHGETIPSAVDADISMMLYHTAAPADYRMVRVAVTDDQVDEWRLPTDPDSEPGKPKVQAESLDDWQIQAAFEPWIDRYHDTDILERNRARTTDLRAKVHAAIR